MNSPLRITLAAMTTAFAVACGKDDMPIKTTSDGAVNTSSPADSVNARGHSLVRVVNTVHNGKDIAVKLGDVALFPDVKAGTATDYRETATNIAQFTVNEAGVQDGMMLAEQDRLLLDGNRYSVFLIADDSSKRSLRVVHDKIVPDSGKARVRVIHAAQATSQLDVSIAGSRSKLFSGVNFKSEAGYADVVPGTVTLDVRGKDASKVVLSIRDLELKRGTATTIVITGTGNKLTYFTFKDALMAPTPKVQ